MLFLRLVTFFTIINTEKKIEIQGKTYVGEGGSLLIICFGPISQVFFLKRQKEFNKW